MAWTTPRTWVAGEVVTSALMNTHLRDNMNQAIGPAATTVSALNTAWGGTPPDGAQGFIRVGSSQYGLLPLRYDSTLAKWTSQPAIAHSMEATAVVHNTTVSTAESKAVQIAHPDNDLYYTAGLVMQVRVTFASYNDSSSFGQYKLVAYCGNTGEAYNTATQVLIDWTRLPASGNLTNYATWVSEAVGDSPSEWITLNATCGARKNVAVQFSLMSNAAPATTNTFIQYPTFYTRYISQ